MARKVESKADYLVFVSHSKLDRWIAKQMVRLIEERGKSLGIRTFLDEKDIDSGDSIAETLRQHLQRCDELLVLLTPNSKDRPWVLLEIGAVWGQGKRIVAIVDKIAPQDMPGPLPDSKAIDLNDFDDYLQQLCARAKRAKPQ